MQTSIGARAVRLAQRQPGATVLAATSFPSDRSFLTSLLRNAGWRVQCVACGGDALRFLWSHRVRVVLCDAALPDCTWQELFEEASNLDPAPAFIIAAESADEWLRALPANGSTTAFVAKPYCREQVLAALAAALERERIYSGALSEAKLCPASG